MKTEDFDLFATLAKQRSGLVLAREKVYLLEARLLHVSRKYNLKSLADMAQLVRSRRDETMMSDIAEAISASHSSFFNDRKSFTQFREFFLPRLLKARASRRHIRIWSAAASSGQEAYSLAMICAEESAALAGWKISITGMDLSQEMVACAQSGTYSHFDVQRGLPIAMLLKYFHQIDPDKWQVNDNIRQMVEFQQGNLLHDSSAVGVFDIVYCRDVLSDFDPPTQTRVLNSIGKALAPDGTLILGRGEKISGILDGFMPMEGHTEAYILRASQRDAELAAVS